MTKCPACGSTDIHRSRSTSLVERGRKLFSAERPHRCHACGWRGWGVASAHRHAPLATADGWEAIEVDLSDLDAAAAERRAQREKAITAAAEGGAPRRHHHKGRGSSSRSASRIGNTEFNRRVQLVLFAVLLLLGIVVVFRACSSGARRVEEQPLGQLGRTAAPGGWVQDSEARTPDV